ncbi:MAG: TIGR04348 family glycosyltransferase [bacterium]|nr:TIGR04348 family glycosyltransferase [bacterium]
MADHVRNQARRIVIVTPAGAGGGNRVTALRWAKLLRELGESVRVRHEWQGEPASVLIALHARRTAASIDRFAAACPAAPLIVASTGTDLYVDLTGGGEPAERVRTSMRLASRVVVLQPLALSSLPPEVHDRARVVYQSLPASTCESREPKTIDGTFDVCVLANVRDVKDPLLAARAARDLPATSSVRVLHAGSASGTESDALETERASNRRYTPLGSLRREAALRVLGRSRLCICTSRVEGGPNAITEALALGVPVLATRIDGCVGLLGTSYPGYFPVGDAAALAALLERAETEPAFLAELQARCRARAWIASPERERESLRALLAGSAQGVPA